MTFDDGPHPKLTPMLLDMMKERGIKGTFFLVGKNVAEYPEIAQRIVAEGHEVANHSWAHPQLTKLAPDALKKEIADTNDAIHRATGIQTTLMRPPYGAINAAITKRLNEEFGLTIAMWSVDSIDWRIRNAAHVTKLITEKAAPGAIILAHDIHPSTVQAMPAVFDTLSAKGYKFVTMSELIALDLPAPIQTAPANTPAGIPTPPPAGIPAATPAGPPIATPAPSLAPRATPATTTP
jgi:peptidoglycan/xylan/chitin deacetylase (PgdA/CDA1 family)